MVVRDLSAQEAQDEALAACAQYASDCALYATDDGLAAAAR
jgi:hypothetical protein